MHGFCNVLGWVKSDVVELMGPKKDVGDYFKYFATIAKEMAESNYQVKVVHVQQVQSGMANITTQEINVPAKSCNTVIGESNCMVSECGGVATKFPVDDVERTVKPLKELSDGKQLSGISVKVKAKLQHHKFLIGRAGDKVSLKGARDCIDAFIARINEIVKDPKDMVTIDDDVDRESVMLIGPREAAEAVKVAVEARVKDLVVRRG